MVSIFNYSAGPALLPSSVLNHAQKALLNYNNTGLSVLELNHREPDFLEILEHAKASLKTLLAIPDTYSILFMQGGATAQFYALPLNLAQNKTAAYLDSGIWSAKAIEEARKVENVNVVTIASSKDNRYRNVPQNYEVPEDAAYLHITTNSTIEGNSIYELPETNVPLVADASSNLLGFDYDISKFGVIYAGAQKNLGIAGVTIVIIRNDLIQKIPGIPAVMDYHLQYKNNSVHNTPPTFAIYFSSLMFDWVLAEGGVPEMQARNHQKADYFYDYIDQSSFYKNDVLPKDRSLTTITFTTGDEMLDALFVKKSHEAGLTNLKGHRFVGGMRASFYNAMPLEGVHVLVEFMKEFAEAHGGTV